MASAEVLNSGDGPRMLEGRTALITGSTSGIGLGIADRLAREGANIILNGFGDVEGSIAQIAALGGEVRYHGADMRQPGEIAELMAYVDSELGGTDILVNNAGIQYVSRIEAFPIDKWDEIIAINQSAVFHTMRLAIPGMREKNWGRVINIASAHGRVASKNKVAYVAAKHAVLGMTKGVALETADTGITANAICPGWVLTAMVQKQIDDLVKLKDISVEQASCEILAEKQPSLEFVTPKEIGGLTVFLCSPDANQIRGEAYGIDGGWTAQ